jgi:hypothetical protein
MLQRSLKTTGPTMIKSQDAVNSSIFGSIPDVGLFGTPGSLPTNSSPPDPAITPGGYSPSSIMQGYMDFYDSNPSAGGATAPNLMDVPGTPTPWQDPSGVTLGGGSGGPNSPPVTVGPTGVDRNAANNTRTDLTHSRPAGGVAGGAGAQPSSPNTPPGYLNPQQYAQNSFGGVTPTGWRDPSGSAINGSPSAANAFQMWAASLGGTPNYTGTTQDAGHTIFYNPATTRRGSASEGMVSSTPANLAEYWNTPKLKWNLPSGQGLSSFGAGVQPYNDWVAQHNKDNYAALNAWQAKRNALVPSAISSTPQRGG